MTKATWVNEDGLLIRSGGIVPESQPGENQDGGAVRTIHADFSAERPLDYTADLDNDGTDDGFAGPEQMIPAGALVKSATLMVSETFTSGGATTLDIGTYQEDGTVIDADGIDALVPIASLTAGNAIACDGALIGAEASATLNSYLKTVRNVSEFTAGAARLVIEYVEPTTVTS